jgi:hypothetical protein
MVLFFLLLPGFLGILDQASVAGPEGEGGAESGIACWLGKGGG